MRTLYLDDLDAHLGFHDLPGPAPVCIYLHGLACASSADYPMVVRSSRLPHHRAVLIDLLGFGFSDRPVEFSHALEAHADVVARLLDHLGLDGCRVVGHSWGGSIAIVLATRRRDLVRHLVVLEPNLEPEDATLSGSIAGQIEADYVALGHTQVIRQAKVWAAENPAYGSYLVTLRSSDSVAMHRAATHLVAASLLTRFLDLDMPRSYLVGALSLPDRHVEVLRERGVRTVVVPDVGHGMLGEDPDAVAEALAGECDAVR